MYTRLQTLHGLWGTWHYGAWLLLSSLIIFVAIELRSISSIVWFYDVSGSLVETLGFIVSLLAGIVTLFSPLGAMLLVLFALSLGMHIVLLTQYIQIMRRVRSASSATAAGASISGLVASVLGIGCASCGAAVLFGLLNIFGATSLLLWLPLQGQEFTVIGVALLLYANWYLLGKLAQPYVCATTSYE